MEKVNKNVDSERKLVGMPVAIYTHFDTMEQKLLFEAVVLPDIRDVLNKYAPALGCLGVSEDIERIESEDKKNDQDSRIHTNEKDKRCCCIYRK